MGLDGMVSCQSFRVFYPSGLAMAALAEALWDPDVPWEEMRRCYLEAAYGKDAGWAGAYLETIETYLDTGDPHWRTLPLSNADEAKLDACAAFLDASLSEAEARREAVGDRTRRRSLDLLVHHITFLQHMVAAYRARLAGETNKADEAFDDAAEHLRRTEPEYSTYIDTMLALRAVERARRQG
jgi:hypothetical protein